MCQPTSQYQEGCAGPPQSGDRQGHLWDTPFHYLTSQDVMILCTGAGGGESRRAEGRVAGPALVPIHCRPLPLRFGLGILFM